jgi:uncharacterized protein YjbI with pentapeptide repeats
MDDPGHLQTGDLFEDETFTGIDLPAADLREKEFQRCVFRRCKLPGSRWASSKLEDCLFEDCDLSRFEPRDLALRGVRFQRSKLMGVDWTDVRPHPDVSFEACDLRYSSFVKVSLRRTRFLACTAREANFLETDLTDADFAESDLTGTTILDCTLQKANFSRAIGALIDPVRNKVKGTQVSAETAILIAESFGMSVAS